MKTRLTPYYIDLVHDACLKSFWRKRSLRKFLQQCGIAESFPATWADDETKRDFLDRLFGELPKSDRSRAALLRMAQYLMDQRSFPDLQNWEDSAQKIKDAHDAVGRLRAHHERQEEGIQSETEAGKAKDAFQARGACQ